MPDIRILHVHVWNNIINKVNNYMFHTLYVISLIQWGINLYPMIVQNASTMYENAKYE